MKQLLGQIAIVGALLLAACNGQQTTMEEFSSEAGQFTISTPVPFEETQQSVQTPVGPVEIYTYTAETENSAYVVAYSDYPTEIIEETDPQVLLDSSRDGAVSNLGGDLVSEEVIDLEGNPGRSLIINTNTSNDEPATVSSHIYLVDNRLYQILVVAPEDSNAQDLSTDFLESFDLN